MAFVFFAWVTHYLISRCVVFYVWGVEECRNVNLVNLMCLQCVTYVGRGCECGVQGVKGINFDKCNFFFFLRKW